ncbi:MAG: repeat protein [Cyanobacteria bacterium RYN_339]|nr:repeat protein [Cyanobacteria bacterium RYN_339]
MTQPKTRRRASSFRSRPAPHPHPSVWPLGRADAPARPDPLPPDRPGRVQLAIAAALVALRGWPLGGLQRWRRLPARHKADANRVQDLVRDPMRRHVLLGLLLSTSLGCTALGGVSPRSSAKPTKVSQVASTPPGGINNPADLISKARLTGKVKLLSPNGGSLVSNNGGQVLSDNGLGLTPDAGGNVLSDNGLGLVSKARYGLTATAPEALLADALVTVLDAAGKAVKDAQGHPIEATTDRTGTFVFTAELPKQGLILEVTLWNGGKLSAMLARRDDAHQEQSIDTATSLGAAFVLGEYVKGAQAILDKLPPAEAERLYGTLRAAATGLLTAPPKYEASELVDLVKGVRAKAPAVDQSLVEIRALLLGQANLGAGRTALEVPLADARAMAPDGKGGFYIAEGVVGRIRHVAADGTLSTLADQLHGDVKENFYGITDLALAPDGALYVATGSTAKVTRIGPDHSVKVVAGTGTVGRGALGKPADQVDMRPLSIAFDTDGTLWIAEYAQDGTTPRVLSVGADGVAREPATASWPIDARIVGLAKAGDGAWYTLLSIAGAADAIYRLAPGATTWALLPWEVDVDGQGQLAAAPDGGLLLAEDLAGRLVHLGLDGKRTVLMDAAKGGAIKRPTAFIALADGRIQVIDADRSQAFELSASLAVTPIAGSGVSGDGATLALNGPFGAAVDPTGLLYLTEVGSHSVQRWNGKQLLPVAGGIKGFAGDDGPALLARLDEPSTLAWGPTGLLIYDKHNSRIRRIGPDGVIRSVFGGTSTALLQPGVAVKSNVPDLRSGGALTVGPDGLPLVSNLFTHQLMRLGADGQVRLLAGKGKGSAGDGGPADQAMLNTPAGLAFGPDGALYVADAGNMRVRRIPNPGAAIPTIEAYAGVDGLAAITRFSAEAFPDTTLKDAVFAFPSALCFDPAGNLYVAEFGTLSLPLLVGLAQGIKDLPLASLPKVPARIRKIAPDGKVTTVAGPGGKFFADTSRGDALILPTGLAVDAQGQLVIVDAGANLVRFLPAGSF